MYCRLNKDNHLVNQFICIMRLDHRRVYKIQKVIDNTYYIIIPEFSPDVCAWQLNSIILEED